jgi:cytochrome P450
MLGLRLGYGTVGRSPRLHKTKELHYGEYVIPRSTPVSASTYAMHHNEKVFPDSHTFDPTRWLNNPVGPDGKKALSRYLVSFSKGTRYCLGMQLSYAIMEMTLATLVMRYDFELYETSEKDIVCTCDLTAAGVWEGSQGIRLLVKNQNPSN